MHLAIKVLQQDQDTLKIQRKAQEGGIDGGDNDDDNGTSASVTAGKWNASEKLRKYEVLKLFHLWMKCFVIMVCLL